MNKNFTYLLLISPMLLMAQYGKAELKRNVRPKAEPSYRAEQMTQIGEGVDVEILDFESNYWLIKYDTIIGWVTPNDLYKTSVMYAKIKEVNELEEKSKNEDMRERILEIWGEDYVDSIMSGRVWIGMTKEMLLESKGYPDYRNTTQSEYGFHEQWVYGKDISIRTYVYLENRIVTAIQK